MRPNRIKIVLILLRESRRGNQSPLKVASALKWNQAGNEVLMVVHGVYQNLKRQRLEALSPAAQSGDPITNESPHNHPPLSKEPRRRLKRTTRKKMWTRGGSRNRRKNTLQGQEKQVCQKQDLRKDGIAKGFPANTSSLGCIIYSQNTRGP